jgi:Fe-Mn family superoxide dismutase
MSFKLAELPWNPSALEPFITANTMSFHYGKHHQAYVTKLNELVKGTPFETMNVTQIVQESFNNPNTVGVFNNAA